MTIRSGLLHLYEKERGSLHTFVQHDPVYFVHLFRRREDVELCGFLASQFAYGSIKGINGFLAKLLSRIGPSPFTFLMEGDLDTLQGLYYRFQNSVDLIQLFSKLRVIYEKYGTMEGLLARFQGKNLRETLSRVSREIDRNGKLRFFFPEPKPSNPLKRWNLYLRWMVRKDEIDMGIWTFLDKRDLYVPLDTHLFKIGRCLGWTRRARPDSVSAEEITEALRAICPDDPLMFDFFLCHRIGIEGRCPGTRSEGCRICPLYDL